MVWPFTKSAPQSFLGIDVGTSSIKVVEISQKGKRKVLENYGELGMDAVYKETFRTFNKNTLLLSTNDVSRALKAIIQESEIKTNRAIFSLPDFATFFTTFELPQMTAKEIPQAVEFEARKYIPLPTSEVVLDWQLLTKHAPDKERNKILLLAVPIVAVAQYKETAKKSGLEIDSLEAEVFALQRSLVRNNKITVFLVEIGAQSTTVSIVDRGVLKTSFSFDAAAKDLTFAVSKSLQVEMQEAEKIKMEKGVLIPSGGDAAKVLMPILDSIITETKKVIKSFSKTEQRRPEEIIIAGGTALMPGLLEYFQKSIKEEFNDVSVKLADPFADIFYPPALEKNIKKMGPAFAIAVGEALKGFE
ncbi:MAG: type IV pilus assembly protein PilM [Candidatus Paceibacterota bacterium]|jgi:type IV pilus assembly protein PilM